MNIVFKLKKSGRVRVGRKTIISDSAQQEKTGLEAKELVVEVHSSGDCCGGHGKAGADGPIAVAGRSQSESQAAAQASTPASIQAPSQFTSHSGVNPLHADIQQQSSREHSSEHQTQKKSCCDKKHSHKHKHSHEHGERSSPRDATSVFSAVLGDEILVSPEESIAHQEHHKQVQRTLLLDNLGIAASTLCLIHCMAMPFLIAFLPFLGLQFLEGELAHRVIALFVFAFAIFAIGPGYLQHRKKQVLVATVFGLSLVAGALLIAGPIFGEKYELPFITTGNLILVVTHLRNRKLCQCIH